MDRRKSSNSDYRRRRQRRSVSKSRSPSRSRSRSRSRSHHRSSRRERSRSRSWSLDSLGRKRRSRRDTERRSRVSPPRNERSYRRAYPTRSRSRSPSPLDRSYGRTYSNKQEHDVYKKEGRHARDFRSKILHGEKGSATEQSTLKELSEEEQMKIMMGFSGFDTTKGKPVEDNTKTSAKGACQKEMKREYRQYMNRRGGFNKPLGKI